MRKFKLILLLFVICYLILPAPSFAQVITVGYSKIDPSSPVYFLKSIKEIVEIKLVTTPRQKSLKYFEFATRRLRESNSLISHQRPDLVAPTLEQYWTNLNKVLVFISIINDAGLSSQLIDKLKTQIVSLEQMNTQTSYHKAQMAILSTVYRISNWQMQLYDRLNQSSKSYLSSKMAANQSLICNLISKSASSSALNQTEQYVTSQRAQKCYEDLKFFQGKR